MSNNDLIVTKTLSMRERTKAAKHDTLPRLFLEVNGNLAPLAWKAGRGGRQLQWWLTAGRSGAAGCGPWACS